jgi:hypothetical protein
MSRATIDLFRQFNEKQRLEQEAREAPAPEDLQRARERLQHHRSQMQLFERKGQKAQEAKRELKEWLSRYEELEELRPLVAAIKSEFNR